MISANKKREELIKAEENLLKLSLSFSKNLSIQRQQGRNFNDSELYKIDGHYKSFDSPQAISTAIYQYGQEILPLEQRILHAFKQESAKRTLSNRFNHTAIRYNIAYIIAKKIDNAIREVNFLRTSLGKPPLSGSIHSILSQQFSQYLSSSPAYEKIAEDLKTAIENRIIKNKWSWFSSKKRSLNNSEKAFLEKIDHDKLADIVINRSHRATCDEMVKRGEIIYVGYGPWRYAKLGAKASPKFRQAFAKRITAQIQKNLGKKDQHLFNNHGFSLAQLEWAAKRSDNIKQRKSVIKQLNRYGLYSDDKAFMSTQLEDAIDTLSANAAFSAYYLSVANKIGWMKGGLNYNSNPPCPPRFKNELNKIINRVLDNMSGDGKLSNNEEWEIILFFDNLRNSDILNLSAEHTHTGRIDSAIRTKISTAINLLTNKLLNNQAGEEGEFDNKFYLMAKRIGLINAKGEISKLASYQAKVCYKRAIQELFTKGNLTENLAKAKELGWLDETYNPTALSPKMFREKMDKLKHDIAESIVQLQSGDELGDFSISNHTANYMKSDLRSGSLQYIELAQSQNWIALQDGRITLTQAGKRAGLTVNEVNTNNIHNHLRANQCKEYLYNLHAGLMSISLNTLNGRDKSNNTIFSHCPNIIEKIMPKKSGIKNNHDKRGFGDSEERHQAYVLSEKIRGIYSGIQQKSIHIDSSSGKITFSKNLIGREIVKLANARISMVEKKTRMIYDGMKSGKIKINQDTGEIDFDKNLLEKSEYSEIYNEIKQGKIVINKETSAISFDENWQGQEGARMINEKIRPIEQKIKAIHLALKDKKISFDPRDGRPVFDNALLEQDNFEEIYNEINQGKITIHPKSHAISFNEDWLAEHSKSALSEEIHEELSKTLSTEIVSVIQQSEEKLAFNECPDKNILSEYSDSEAMNDEDIDFDQSHLQSNNYSRSNPALIINSPSFSNHNNGKAQKQSNHEKINDKNYDPDEIDYVRSLI